MSGLRGPRILGLTLVLLSAATLANTQGVPALAWLWRLWPLVLIGVGAWHLRPDRSGAARRLGRNEQWLVGLVIVAGLTTTLLATGPDGKSTAGRSEAMQFAPPDDQDLVERQQAQATIQHGATLTLEIQGAEVELQPGEAGRVTANLATSPDDASPGEVDLTTDDAGGVIVRFAPRSPQGQQVRLTVRAPTGTPVVGRITDGRLTAHNTGPFALEAESSQIQLVGVTGTVSGRIANSRLFAESIRGTIALEASNADLEVTSVDGAVAIRSSFTNVELNDVAGAVEVAASDARVSLGDVTGPTQVKAPRCHLFLRNLSGGGSVATTAGMIRANRLVGPFTVTADESNLSVQNTNGRLEVRATDRQVTIAHAEGEVELDARRAAVRIRHCNASIGVVLAGGSLELSSNQGSVRVNAADAELGLEVSPGSPIELSGQRSNVALQIGPAGGLFDLQAKTGSIIASRQTSLSERIERRAADVSLNGSLGSSRTPVSAVIEHGIIRLIHH